MNFNFQISSACTAVQEEPLRVFCAGSVNPSAAVIRHFARTVPKRSVLAILGFRDAICRPRIGADNAREAGVSSPIF